MTDASGRYGNTPLGRSAEEIEGETTNRVNSPVPGEQVRQDEGTVAVIPAVSNSNTSITPGVIAPDTLLTDSVMAEERRDRAQADTDVGQSSENSES